MVCRGCKRFFGFLERLGVFGDPNEEPEDREPEEDEELKIFQEFDLNLEAMAELSDTERARLNLPNLPDASKTLRRELLGKGYQVLQLDSNYCDVPERIIVGGDYYRNIKGDFYALTQKLGLPFNSGHYYA